MNCSLHSIRADETFEWNEFPGRARALPVANRHAYDEEERGKTSQIKLILHKR